MPDHQTREPQVLGTAASHASMNVPLADPADTVDEVLAKIRGRRFDSVSIIAVCVGDRLVGVARIEAVLAAAAGTMVVDVADPDPPVVAPHVDQERAAWTAVHNNEPGLSVTDSAGRFLGLIVPQRILAVLLAEHDQDLARLGGFLGSAAAARSTSQEPVSRRLWHRLPWLLVGLVGAMLAAGVVGAFEAELESQVLLAFFVPGVVYMADAVGTQTETLIIRGLSVGVSVRNVARREIVTGLLVGAMLAAALLPATLLLWREPAVSVAVSLAIFAACSIATLVAMALPWAFHRVGQDPAYGSGPLATVVQDLLSIIIYLGIASAVIN